MPGPSCSSSRQYPVLALLLQGRTQCPCYSHEAWTATEQRAPASEPPTDAQACATLPNASVQRSSAGLDPLELDARPGLVTSEVEGFCLADCSSEDLAEKSAYLQEVMSLPLVATDPAERQESEWSILSFSSLCTDLTVELSEAVDASDDER